MFYNKMLLAKKLLEEKNHLLQKQIESCTAGKIIHTKNGIWSKWYCSDGKNLRYIKKSEQELLKKLCIKKYLTFLQEDLMQEKKAIDAYLKYHNPNQSKSDQLLEEQSPYLPYLKQYFIPKSEELRQWAEAPYKISTEYPEHLIHKAITGQMVRSKSEALIIMCLVKYNIPFRYECELVIDGIRYYPDFTIRHPRTGEIIYWEHLGKMDDPGYVHKNYLKLENYNKNDIIQSVNLITTYETKAHPLNANTVEEIINKYLL